MAEKKCDPCLRPTAAPGACKASLTIWRGSSHREGCRRLKCSKTVVHRVRFLSRFSICLLSEPRRLSDMSSDPPARPAGRRARALHMCSLSQSSQRTQPLLCAVSTTRRVSVPRQLMIASALRGDYDTGHVAQHRAACHPRPTGRQAEAASRMTRTRKACGGTALHESAFSFLRAALLDGLIHEVGEVLQGQLHDQGTRARALRAEHPPPLPRRKGVANARRAPPSNPVMCKACGGT